MAARNHIDVRARARKGKWLEWPYANRRARARPELHLERDAARLRPTGALSAPPGSAFDADFIVRTLAPESGARAKLDLRCAPDVARRWRDALLTQVHDAPAAVRRLLSGHDDDGAPLPGPHLAFVPLACVGQARAAGRLLGMGLVLPRAIAPAERRGALLAIERIERLVLGRLGVWRVGSACAAEPPWDLRPQAWTAHPEGATHWSTVTPIAFDRHPKSADGEAYRQAAGDLIAQACVRIGLPAPREVIVTPISAHLGVPPAHAFPRLQRKDGSLRRHAHAILVFGEPVRGPILIGAGRFRAYGVCRPLGGLELESGSRGTEGTASS